MKRKNLKHEEIIKYVKMHHEKGRKINTDLLVPSGGETLESHLNSLRTSFDVDEGFSEGDPFMREATFTPIAPY